MAINEKIAFLNGMIKGILEDLTEEQQQEVINFLRGYEYEPR